MAIDIEESEPNPALNGGTADHTLEPKSITKNAALVPISHSELPICHPVPEEQISKQQAEKARPTDNHSRGRFIINLGDGCSMRLLRNNRRNQNQIVFSAPAGVKPNRVVDRQWLCDKGWWWRKKEEGSPWTIQIATSSDADPFARAASDRKAEEEFVELANCIRHRNGLEPVKFKFSNGQDERSR